jgi:hypothetical protein
MGLITTCIVAYPKPVSQSRKFLNRFGFQLFSMNVSKFC